MGGEMGEWVLLGMACALGIRHAFDADHLAAVTAFVGTTPDPRAALRFALHWGLGHGVTLLIAGGIVVAFRVVIPQTWERGLEFIVGALMVGVGLWALRLLFRRRPIHLHPHGHEGEGLHLHFHSHLGNPSHRHSHTLLLVGAAHGLAGTAGVMALLPVALFSSPGMAVLYLVAFGVGAIVAMGLYALALSRVFTSVSRWRRIEEGMTAVTGLASVVVGVVWILRGLLPGAG